MGSPRGTIRFDDGNNNVKVRFFELLDHPYMVRRVLFVWILATLTYSVYWMFDFAKSSPRPGTDVAAIIAAINAPLCFLFGALMGAWQKLGEDKPAIGIEA